MNEWVALLSMVPGIEAMWSSSYFFYSSQLLYIPFCVVLNFLAVFAFVKVLDKGMLPERIERLLERRREKAIKRVESWFHKYGNLALFLLIGLPFTGIGSYTGAFIGRVFELKGRTFYLMILGSICLSVLFGYFIGYSAGVFFRP